jgi:hypothetical protein
VDEIDETELLGALHSGRAVDGDLDGAKRAVSAAVLRSCCYEFRDQVDPRGLRLTNTVIAGELDLAGLTVPFPLRFHGCEFDSAPVLEGAELFELSLTSCPRLAAKVFREGTTNIIRHSDATACTIELHIADSPRAVTLSMDNDRVHALDAGAGGTGLAGLGERLAGLGGSITTRRPRHGHFRLEGSLPACVTPAAPPGPGQRGTAVAAETPAP